MPLSAYIHIPFCKTKCKYCSFVSECCVEKIDKYINALCSQIELLYKGEQLKTVYFGGGTPSLLSINNIKKILRIFNLHKINEVTFELNPDDAQYEYLCALQETGINRLSIGAQSFNDKLLAKIGRRHNSEQTINTVKMAKKAGFKNISIDLIYGLPEQNIQLIKWDLNKIIDLDIQHISTYGLKIEENSYFYNNLPENLPDDDMQADMYLFINEYLKENDFLRYEISNFSKIGYESMHNLTYWNNREYYGFGVSAHGYVDSKRYSNVLSIDDYIQNPTIYNNIKTLSIKEKTEEEIFLGFRKNEGINIKKIKEKYGFDFEEKYGEIIEKYMPKYIEKTDIGYKLTTEGVLLSNIILSEFL